MTKPRQVESLATLVTLREREVDRLQADMAEKESVRERFRGNLERMERLCAGTDAAGPLPVPLSLNFGHYKQHLLGVAETHRTDLALHEADMAVTQRALSAAALRREVLGQVLADRRRQIRRQADVRDQKRQDEIALQLWVRKATP